MLVYPYEAASSIEAKPDVMMGKPCIKGTRIPVYLMLQKMAAGEGSEQLLEAYPQLTSEDLAACRNTQQPRRAKKSF
jgi:uncharacterized protein (DUF433 family)